MSSEMTLRLDEFERALLSLEKALLQPKDEFTRDASIQRFEYTLELAWKVSKKALEILKITSLSPRSVIRDMGQQLWIEDVALWMSFLDSRNMTSHTYNEKIADQVYEAAKAFLPEAKNLYEKLKQVQP